MSHLQQRLALFKIQPFRLYVLSCVIAMLGNGLSYIAMTWLVLQLKNSITSVTIVMFCFWLPTVVLGPFAGVLVDRYPRKPLFVVTNFARALLLIVFGFYEYYHPSLYGLYLLSLLQGVVFSLVLPVIMALIREIVAEKQLLIANATVDIGYEIGNVMGMATAGFVIALVSMAGTLILDGFFFVIAGLLSIAMRVDHKEKINETALSVKSIFADMRLGFSYVAKRRPLIVIYTIQLLVMVAFMTVPILIAPFASNVLKANVSEFGMIEAALSVGVIIGGFTVPWIAEKYGLLRVIMVLLIVLAAAFAVFSFNRSIVIAEELNLVIGYALAVWPLIMTKAQELTELDFQGRVQSTFNCLSGAGILLIYCLVDFGSHWMSLTQLYWIEVVFSALGVILIVFNRKIFDVSP
ncbi:MAG: MFS transporter [Coxiellaceae bacterium]|nr:MFS transporter [Coxiellaceae bacterium]